MFKMLQSEPVVFSLLQKRTAKEVEAMSFSHVTEPRPVSLLAAEPSRRTVCHVLGTLEAA